MCKFSPNPPDNDPASPRESRNSKTLHEAAESDYDNDLKLGETVMDTPRTAGTICKPPTERREAWPSKPPTH